MKRRILVFLLALCLAAALVPVTAFAEGGMEDIFRSGAGTKKNPWLITSHEDLIALADFLNTGKAEKVDAQSAGIGHFHGYYFKQTADIDLTGVDWKPIGYSSSIYFAGNYDGGGHIIANAKSTGKVDDKGHATAGIFGYVFLGSVQNLHVKAAEFVATEGNNYSHVGGITGTCCGASIQKCSVTDSILESKRKDNNNNCAGSIAGYSVCSSFNNCAAKNNQVTSMAYGGGFVGELADNRMYGLELSVFTNCYVADCTVTATTGDTQGVSLAGGFVGEISVCTLDVKNCYVYRVALSTDGTATSTVSTGVFAGHLTGKDAAIKDTNCFYGECGTKDRAGNAEQKSAEEFKDGTVAKRLGGEFVQHGGSPSLPSEPADYRAVDAAIAKANALNKDEYKDFSAVETAVNAVVRGNRLPDQADVDAMAKTIEDAIAALQYKDADYTKVDAALAKANALKKDDYKDFSAVETAVNAVARGKNITKQGEVDAMAKTIEDAIAALQYKDADYTKVDAALAKANALKKDDYKDFSAVETAVNAVARGKNITKQGEVDAMAKAIEDALAALQYKGADYSAVDAAIAKADKLNRDEYKDFSAVEAAVRAVVRGKPLSEQDAVDAMAKAIEDAIAALQYKGADYSKVDAAIAKADALNRDEYKDFSAVEAAVRAVVRGKPLTKQAEVDAMAKAIEDAMAALEKKPVEMTVQLPQTGDDSNLALWMALLLVSGAAICTMMAGKKKNYGK